MSILDKFSRKKSDYEITEEKVEEKIVTEEQLQEQKKEENIKKGTDFENYILSLFPENGPGAGNLLRAI